MNQDILLSKIVPNATDTTWAQAYTTLNVYITLSIEKEDSKTPVTTYGKELLEKLQREFFALDDKSLENIKKAVGNVSTHIDDGYAYSIIVGAIVGDILYIVIASTGQVVIKRKDKVGVIATGVEGELHGFSGKLVHDDIIVLETGDFTKKIPLSSLSEYLSSTDVSQIAENITPLVHEGSKGTEGAIILQYKDMRAGKESVEMEPFESDIETKEVSKSEEKDFHIKDENEELKPEDTEEDTYTHENLWTTARQENRNIEHLSDGEDEQFEETDGRRIFPSFKIPDVNFANKKIIIGALVVILVALLAGSIFFQVYKKDQEQKTAEFNKIIEPIQSKFDEGTSLSSLNKTLALEDFNATSKMIDDIFSKYPKSSFEFKKLSDLKSQIESKVSELGGGSSAKNIKEILKPGGKIKSITSITSKGGVLTILDKQGHQVATADTDGTLKKTYDIKESDTYISADDKFVYAMGENVTSVDRGNGKVALIAKNVKGTSFDIFGSNLYTLEGDDILKYKPPTYDSSSYFTDKPSFKNTPYDLSISGPIWVLESEGTIERFTKGKNDDISISGLSGPIADGAHIYADSDNDNVYVMDVKNQRVVVINSKGEYQTQYEGSFIKGATSFAIDEKNKIGYVLSNGTIFSFDL